MNHKERLAELLTDMGVAFHDNTESYLGQDHLMIEAKDGPKNTGYAGFVCVFTFDTSGNLDHVGVWE